MVKNTKGGNKGKSMARKLITAPTSSSIRLPQSPLELFAIVTKHFGTICEVTTHDNKLFKCIIRGKFRGRNKRNSLIELGKIVLIGLREWEAPNFLHTDLLEIYEHSDIHSLSIIPNSPIPALLSLNNNNTVNNDVLFSNYTQNDTIDYTPHTIQDGIDTHHDTPLDLYDI
jgi:hypothetical protein